MSATPMLLRRASKACYAYGLYMLGGGVFAVLAVVFMMLSIYGAGYQNPYSVMDALRSFLQAFINVYFPLWVVVGVVAVVAAVFFSFYLFKVGKVYDLASLRASSLLIIAMQALSFVMTFAFYAFSVSILEVYLSPTLTLQSMSSLLLITVPASAIGLAYMVLLIVGTGRMSEKTGVKAFDSAKPYMIVGIFVFFLFPVGLFKFGSGLKELIVLQEGIICPGCGKSVDPRMAFCKFCGTRLKKEQV
jgi:hypothetical protein